MIDLPSAELQARFLHEPPGDRLDAEAALWLLRYDTFRANGYYFARPLAAPAWAALTAAPLTESGRVPQQGDLCICPPAVCPAYFRAFAPSRDANAGLAVAYGLYQQGWSSQLSLQDTHHPLGGGNWQAQVYRLHPHDATAALPDDVATRYYFLAYSDNPTHALILAGLQAVWRWLADGCYRYESLTRGLPPAS